MPQVVVSVTLRAVLAVLLVLASGLALAPSAEAEPGKGNGQGQDGGKGNGPGQDEPPGKSGEKGGGKGQTKDDASDTDDSGSDTDTTDDTNDETDSDTTDDTNDDTNDETDNGVADTDDGSTDGTTDTDDGSTESETDDGTSDTTQPVQQDPLDETTDGDPDDDLDTAPVEEDDPVVDPTPHLEVLVTFTGRHSAWLEASGTGGLEGDDLWHYWFVDGIYAGDEPRIHHSFLWDGDHEVTLYIEDVLGHYVERTLFVPIHPPYTHWDQVPDATFTATPHPEGLLLATSAAVAPDDDTMSHTWTIDGVDVYEGAQVVVPTPELRPYDVRLDVHDGHGLSDTARRTILVDGPLVPQLDYIIEETGPDADGTITIDAAATWDRTDTPMTFTWHIDGAPVDATTDRLVLEPASVERQVTLRATNGDGAYNTTTITIAASSTLASDDQATRVETAAVPVSTTQGPGAGPLLLVVLVALGLIFTATPSPWRHGLRHGLWTTTRARLQKTTRSVRAWRPRLVPERLPADWRC